MILLEAPKGHYSDFISGSVSVDPGVPYLVREIRAGSDQQFIYDVDSAFKRVLRNFAIDPAKIAVSGNSYAGALSVILGRNNPDVFSRIAPRSPGNDLPLDGPLPRIPTTQFYFSAGVAEADFILSAMQGALAARRDGYPVKFVLEPKGHLGSTGSDVPHMFRWFHESWAAPEQARRTARPRSASPGPLLTTTALTQWTTFWTRFLQEPVSIRDTARKAHIKEVATLIGREPVTLIMMDISAMAAQYPSVAADLEAAGLTARQAEAYRVALLSAWSTLQVKRITAGRILGELITPDPTQLQQSARPLTGAEMRATHDRLKARAEQLADKTAIFGAVAPNSVLGKNIAFLLAQPKLLRQLERTDLDSARDMWWTIP